VKSKPDNGPADALILPDVPTDRLIITASEKQMPLLEKLVNDLDHLAADGQREIRLFTLKHNTASAATTIIREIFNKNLGNTDLAQRLQRRHRFAGQPRLPDARRPDPPRQAATALGAPRVPATKTRQPSPVPGSLRRSSHFGSRSAPSRAALLAWLKPASSWAFPLDRALCGRPAASVAERSSETGRHY
jgi:hypothetical protein